MALPASCSRYNSYNYENEFRTPRLGVDGKLTENDQSVSRLFKSNRFQFFE